MNTRAKFKCHSVEKIAHWNSPGQFLYTAKFTAVTDTTPENKTFWQATPSGDMTLTCIHVDAFEPGKFYYLDFTQAV